MSGAPSTTTRRVRRLPLGVALRWSISAASVTTVIVVALLWIQMSSGNDPALGPKLARQRTLAASPTAPASSDGVLGVLPSGEEESEGVQVVPVTPQTSPTPAPAPTPAPVQTTTS